MSILTDVTYTNLISNFGLNPASSRNFEIDLRTVGGINSAINRVKTQMLDQGWTVIGEYLASTTFHAPAIVGTSTVGFSKITADWYGTTLQFYQVPETNPTGGPGLSPGTTIYGILCTPGDDQTVLLGKLAGGMQDTCLDDFAISAGAGDIITITANPGHGPSLNDKSFTANVAGGYSFSGATKGGGWELTSVTMPDHSPVTVAIRNKDGRNYFSIDATINGNPCIEVLIERRHNYRSVVSPYMWCLFRLNDGTSYSSGDIYVQYDNYLICAPEMYTSQLAATPPMTDAVFAMVTPRTQMNESANVITCVNGDFSDSGFSAFNSDVGVTFYLFNSMYTSAGALTTTSDKYLTFAALVGLSTTTEPGLRLIGPCLDMFTTTKYFPLDTLSIGPGGHTMIAYRSQTTPCEATLWLALD